MVGKSESVRRTLRRQRRAALPEEPKCASDLQLDKPWTTTGGSDPGQFLVHDSGKDSTDRLLVFASERALEVLAEATDWFVDGTFDVCPRIFKQLYVIRTLVDGIPVHMAFSQGRRGSTMKSSFKRYWMPVKGMDILPTQNTFTLTLSWLPTRLSTMYWDHMWRSRGVFTT